MFGRARIKQAVGCKTQPEKAFCPQPKQGPRMMAARQLPLYAAIVTGWSCRPLIGFSRPEPDKPVICMTPL